MTSDLEPGSLPLLHASGFRCSIDDCAGPPYITDDPDPVEYRHWEIYMASIFDKQPGAWTTTAPHLEVNYGLVPNL
jgi:hypothetical protein